MAFFMERVYPFPMPAVSHRKKKKADEKDVNNRRKVVSAYSEEGAERNLADAKKAKRLRIVTLTLFIVLLLGTIAATILILRFLK